MRLFGHVLHASPADPMNQVSFDVDNLRPRPVHCRRIGRPKSDWIIESYRDAFESIHGPGIVFDATNREQLQQVKNQAILRQPPFS